jgi:hypothetical protein
MKPVRVVLIGQAREEYERLNIIVGENPDNNIPEAQLFRSIKNKTSLIKQNPFYGDNIKKRSIPSGLDVENLWRVELTNYWRLLYTVRGDEIEIICFVLRIIDHKTYDSLMGYRKK